MSYFRLRDVKTPPFAYVINKDELVRNCDVCYMPFQHLQGSIQVEICITETHQWRKRILGRPLMADHWLIGDEIFAESWDQLLPGAFEKHPIRVVSWLTQNPRQEPEGSALIRGKYVKERPYFYFFPKQDIELNPNLLKDHPPFHCYGCRREIPDIPIEFQPFPALQQGLPPVAYLRGFYFEGYDYLFHEDLIGKIEALFPEMILEQLVPHPSYS